MSDTWHMDFEGESGPAFDDHDERLRLSDLGKLARRSRRRVVAGGPRRRPADVREAAVASTSATIDDLDVVEESWPALRPRQRAGRPSTRGWPERVAATSWSAIARFRHRDFGLADLLRPQDRDDYGPRPGNVGARSLPSGPDGQVRHVRAGRALPGPRRDDDPRRDPGARRRPGARHDGRCGCTWSPTDPARPPRRRRRDPRARRRAQRVPRPGDLVRQRHVRRARPPRCSSTAGRDVDRRPA